MTRRFLGALAGEIQTIPPIWFMRQAGRYQQGYQDIRRQHSFEALCREPDLSARVALRSIEDFDFDAAILFSDLLFPLDALGIRVRYDDSGPHLDQPLTADLLPRLRGLEAVMADLQFQAAAVAETRRRLDGSKGLIGFIGGPWTLFVYALEGSHKGTLLKSKTAFDLYRRFARVIVPILKRMATAQLEAGADLVMIFDTAAGELSPASFRRHVLRDLETLADHVPGQLGYYGRGLHPAHFAPTDAAAPRPRGVASMPPGPWAGVGVDWRWSMPELLTTPGRRGFVQGNFDPALLHLTGAALTRALDDFLAPIAALPPRKRRGWICGLGHGVLPATPEASVRAFVRNVRKRFA